MIRFSVERDVPAPSAELYAWMSDYSNGDYTGPNWSNRDAMKRSVVEQDSTHAVFIDYYGRSRLNYRAEKHPGEGIEARGAGPNLNGHVSLRVSPAPGGSKLSVDFEFEPLGIAKLFASLMRGQIEKATISQVDSFLEDFYASRR